MKRGRSRIPGAAPVSLCHVCELSRVRVVERASVSWNSGASASSSQRASVPPIYLVSASSDLRPVLLQMSQTPQIASAIVHTSPASGP